MMSRTPEERLAIAKAFTRTMSELTKPDLPKHRRKSIKEHADQMAKPILRMMALDYALKEEVRLQRYFLQREVDTLRLHVAVLETELDNVKK